MMRMMCAKDIERCNLLFPVALLRVSHPTFLCARDTMRSSTDCSHTRRNTRT